MSSEQLGSSSPLPMANGSAAASSPAPRQSAAGPSSDAATAHSTQPSFAGAGIANSDTVMHDGDEANGADSAGESDGEQEEGDEEEPEEEAEEEEEEEEESGDDEGSEEEEEDDDDEGSDSGESSRSMATGDGEERGVEAALGGEPGDASAAAAVQAVDANGQPAQTEGSTAAATQGAEGSADAAAAAPQDGSDPAAGPSDPTIHKPKVKKRRRQNRTPSPGTMLPEGPPPRPSMRMTLTPLPVGRDPTVDYKDYTVSVPDLMYDTLKAAGQSGPWMSYWEKKRRDAEEAEAAKVAAAAPPPEVPNDIPADLPPELAALLAKHQETGVVKKKRKRRQMKEDQYDPKDPFVDDSELQFDEPTHSAKPDSDGFFVQYGAVVLETISKKPRKTHVAKAADGSAPALSAAAVLNAATSAAVLYGIGTSTGIRGSTTGSSAAANRMLAKRALDRGILPPMPPKRENGAPERSPSISRAGGAMGLGNLLNGGPSEAASPSRSPALGDESRRSVSRMSEGTRAAPIDIDEDDNVSITEQVLAKYEKALEGTEIKNRVYRSDPRMLQALDELKVLIDAQDWSTKGRFPPALKPALVKISRLALDLGEYNENFFSWMPHLFPYNRFTMHKLIKREFYVEHHSYLKLLQSEHMQQLEQSLRDDLPAHQADHAAAVAAWERRGSPSRDEAPANGAAPEAALAGGDVSMTNGDEANDAAAAEGGPPEKKWRFSDDQRHQICICVVIEDAMAQVQAEKIGFEKGEVPTTIIMARKNLYARLAELLPEPGWSTSTQISREFANLKRRFAEALGTDPKLDQ
ncbi:hypothetical protein FA09DRAFT_208539 [Tilletiopsis washingtonensis]|uniref:Ubinuclein middle domain-containing protein n=1 Tax=Tilletiopsis washingtonensis TaxID=58919 RepID=A0A316ZG03_9BASI|nr:hypothetical protein FA09DRAFT_208539 [Tilletiopsis washingtonensis]PWO00167.1 hypothetical protein FA09DRAFT_208539 [Tilletiopsis washingtonensis]